MVHVNQYEESNGIDYTELMEQHIEEVRDRTATPETFASGDEFVEADEERRVRQNVNDERWFNTWVDEDDLQALRDMDWEIIEWSYTDTYAIWEYQGEPPESDQTIAEEFRSDLEDVQDEVGTSGIAGEPFDEISETRPSKSVIKCKGTDPDWDAIYTTYTYALAERGWIMVGSDSEYNTFKFEKVTSVGTEEE